MILACPGNRDPRAVLENWGLGDPLERRAPRDKKAHVGHREQLETLAVLDLWAHLVPAAPPEVRAPPASEGPLGKTGSAERRAQQVRKGVQDQLVPGGIRALLAFLGHLDRERMESRGCVDHLDYLGH